ncbi:MAG TPA: DHHW family protein [Allosphingosinicella sp.]|nr:DHHW family protein [Allosphingosinicella sp.]
MAGSKSPRHRPPSGSGRKKAARASARAGSVDGGPLETPPEVVLAGDAGGRFMLWINALAFVCILILGGVAFWLTPQQSISASEKRELARVPDLTLRAVFDGSYERRFEEFYNDNFPWREQWVELTATLKRLRGVHNAQQIEVFNEAPVPPQARRPSFVPVDEEYRRVRSVIVVGDRAVQQFGGTAATLTPFVDMIRQYHEALPQVRLYVMSIPVGSDMFLPRQVNDGQMLEKRNIDLLHSRLPAGVVPVRAYDAMLPHREEYIQFRTDHHWTGRGAYYAYRAFAEAAGFTPLRLDQMSYGRTRGEFLGTLYYRTRSPALSANPDHVEYWKVPGETRVTVFTNSLGQGRPGLLYHEQASGGNSYGVFLGGDFPLIRIETQHRSGRSILVVKDSYGNAFVPYLAAHYDRIFVVDYRHFRGNIPQFMAENAIGELLYAHNSLFTNSRGTVARGLTMLQQGRR